MKTKSLVMMWVLFIGTTFTQYTHLFAQDMASRRSSKKGLQVEWIEDALSLGIQHATLNVNLSQLVAPQPGDLKNTIKIDGFDNVFLRRDAIGALDTKIKQLWDHGVSVNLILLVYESGQPAIDEIMLHPSYQRAAPNRLSAFNMKTPEGFKWLTALFDFLVKRYSDPGAPFGRVTGYIVGNEVNSHWWWANCGALPLNQFVEEYAKVLRRLDQVIQQRKSEARIYVSLDHHWTRGMDPSQPDRCFGARPFLETLNRVVRESGDFAWHVAFHPYPENLFEPRFWNDRAATFRMDTEKVTFKNLEVLCAFMEQPDFLDRGKPRRIILSEQGFHTPDGPEGEKIQAAAYCFAYKKIERLENIDAFILHRHIDHPREGGLRLGLRSLTPNDREARPTKKIYECFRAAGTEDEEEVFRFALAIVGPIDPDSRPTDQPVNDWSSLTRPIPLSPSASPSK